MKISKVFTAAILSVSIFSSTSFAAPVTAQEEISITKELAKIGGTHTFWHIHHKSCQILIAAAGRGSGYKFSAYRLNATS